MKYSQLGTLGQQYALAGSTSAISYPTITTSNSVSNSYNAANVLTRG